MRIEPVPGVRLSSSPAVEAYLFDFDRIAPAYQYDWRRQESFAERAAYLRSSGFTGDRKALAEALTGYNQALGASPETLENIRLLAQEGTLSVVTGQQGAIFTGPSYSIYKAMTTIHLAREQSEKLGVPVVPVFWIAGEDHDWPEHASVLVPARDEVTRLALKEEYGDDRRSVGLAPLPPSVPELIEEFLELMPDTEFKPVFAERIRVAAGGAPALETGTTDGEPTLSDWFGRTMAWLFEGTGLIFINPVDPALRRLMAPFFERAIRDHAAVESALEIGFNLCHQMAFQPTVDQQPGNLNLFTYLDGQRLAIYAGEGGRYHLRNREEINWSAEELVDLAVTHPERFSTNVILRPVVQGRILPDLAYVGGPGELSYFGLYRHVYSALEMQMPIIFPRESYTLVEPPLARIMEKQSLTVEDLFFRLDERRQEFLEREDRLGLAGLFERFRGDFDQLYDGVVQTVLQLDPNLQFVTDENRKQIAVQINKLEEKARQQHRKNLEVFMRQYDRLKANIQPHGGLQERAVSILPYLVKYGPDLVRQMVAETELGDVRVHRAIFLGT